MKVFQLHKEKKRIEDEIRLEILSIHKYLFDNGAFDVLFYDDNSMSTYEMKRDTLLSQYFCGEIIHENIKIYNDTHLLMGVIVSFSVEEYGDTHSISDTHFTLEELTDPIILKSRLTKILDEGFENGEISKTNYREIRLKKLL